jgi:alkylation response protein AidB-like acyl-CoA dehydrogenase
LAQAVFVLRAFIVGCCCQFPNAAAVMSWTEQWVSAVEAIRSDLGYDNSAEQLRALTKTGLLKLTDLRDNPDRFFEAHRLLAERAPTLGPGFWIRFTVHYNLCFGSVLAVGSEEQIQQLDDIQQNGLLGCFALTEKLAGVNSGMVVQTTADWDDEAREFVLESASEGAHKNWISQGLIADLACVVADLRLHGRSYGAHAFLVEFRKDGKVLPNIELGDMGEKTVGNDLDNAWIAFHKMRVPHRTLLSRYAEVIPGNGGSYVSKAKGFNNMMMIGQRLFSGRVAVSQAALTFTRKLYDSTRTFSDGKVVWGPNGNTRLTAIPQLNALYSHADSRLKRLEAFLSECQGQLAGHLKSETLPSAQLQDAIACAKIVASETSIDLCFRLKQDVGSFALMGHKGFDQMDFLQACKFAEGDSRILMQKLARDRVRSSKQIGSEKEQSLAAELKQVAGQGPQAWDENFERVYELAWAVVTRIVGNFVPGEPLPLPIGLSRL